MNNYDWNLVLKDGGNGHSLWFDKNEKSYAIKDRSGSRPHLTDNGVLWVDVAGNATVGFLERWDDKLVVNIPLIDKRGSSCSTICEFDFGIDIVKKFGMSIEITDAVKKIHRQIKISLELLSLAQK